MKKLIFLLTVMMSIAWMDKLTDAPVWQVYFQYRIENVEEFPDYLFFDNHHDQIKSKKDVANSLLVLPKAAIKNDSFYIELKANGRRAWRDDLDGMWDRERLFGIPFLQEIKSASKERTREDSITHTLVTFQIRFDEITEGSASVTITGMEKETNRLSYRQATSRFAKVSQLPVKASLDLDVTYKNGVWKDKEGHTYPDLIAIYNGEGSYSYSYWIILSLAALTLIVIVILRRRKSKA